MTLHFNNTFGLDSLKKYINESQNVGQSKQACLGRGDGQEGGGTKKQ